MTKAADGDLKPSQSNRRSVVPIPSSIHRNGHLARSVGDAGMQMFRTQIEYKTAMTGAFLYIHPRFAPSTKVCSGCGQVQDMRLGKDTLPCDCGLVIDRDLNAAIILKTAASSAVAACG